jgi:hypothetical protein
MVMMALTLLTGLGTALIVGTMIETAVTAAYRQGLEAFYAADAAAEFAIRDLATRADWDPVITGTDASVFTDGLPGGLRKLGVTTIDLTRATGEVNVLLASRTIPAASRAELYAYGTFERLLAASEAPVPAYVCVWVAELVPKVPAVPPVRLLYIVGRAYGATGGQRTVLVTVARPLDADELLEVRLWEEPR